MRSAAEGVARAVTAEALGTALLLAVVVGSGIMGERLAGGVTALALLANSLATGAALVVLISVFAPLSGAHFNPAVSLVFALRRELAWPLALFYIAAQLGGAVLGVWMAHLMFDAPILEVSQKARSGTGQLFSEFVASFGLILTILGGLRARVSALPLLVGLYITSAYWFTASTSFANPAVTLARCLSDSFAGIAPHCVPGFVAAQFAGAVAAAAFCGWLFRAQKSSACA